MRVQDLAQLSTRMFKTNPLRTWLTILGMGVGTAAVVVLVGLGFGLQQIILEQIVFGETLLSLGVSSTGAQGLRLTPETVAAFEAKEEVVDAAPLARFPALVTYKGLTGNVFVQGVEPPYLRYAGVTASVGEVFLEEDAENTDSIMLSPATLKLFGIADEDVESFIGERVSFRLLVPAEDGTDNVDEIVIDKEYIVRGITKEEGVLNALMMLPELRNYVGIEQYERIQVRVDTNENLPIIEEQLIEEGYRVTALSKTVEQASKIFQGVQVVLATFGGIALIVSAIGMFNTMTVTLLERTKEIGIRKATGAQKKDIVMQFISESVTISIVGSILGWVVGIAGLFGLVEIINRLTDLTFRAALSLDTILIVAAVAVFIGIVFGTYPAWKAANLTPVDAIRHE